MSVLVACSGCARLVREPRCPFCAAKVTAAGPAGVRRATRAVALAGAMGIAAAGCAMGGYGGPPPEDPTTPAASTPAGSTPAGSTPAGSTPAGSTPAGSAPAGDAGK